MQVRIVTAAFALACAVAFVASFSSPASAYVGPTRNGDSCWKTNGAQGIGHWEPCPADKTHAALPGRKHSKHR